MVTFAVDKKLFFSSKYYYCYPFLVDSGRMFGLVYSPWEPVRTNQAAHPVVVIIIIIIIIISYYCYYFIF